MPKREDGSDSTEQLKAQNGQNNNGGGDVWDDIMDMKSASFNALVEDEGGFTKMSSNFYLTDGEETEIQMLSETPHAFQGHNLKLMSKKNKPYYVVETCQKTAQKHCVLCSTKSKNVGDLRQLIAFGILDYRGTYDTKTNTFDGVPAPRIFLTPLGLAKAFKRLRDEVGGRLTDKVIKLTKDSKNYNPSIKTIPNPADNGASLVYKKARPFSGAKPNISVLYAPQTDDYLNNLVNNAIKSDSDAETTADDSAGSGSSGLFNR